MLVRLFGDRNKHVSFGIVNSAEYTISSEAAAYVILTYRRAITVNSISVFCK